MALSATYPLGPAFGLSRALYSPSGTPWCDFEAGSIRCINGRQCLNPGHAETRRGLSFLIQTAPCLAWR